VVGPPTLNSSHSTQIGTTDIVNNNNANPKISNNAITTAKLLQDAVHVVWDDNSPESPDVYYRTNAGDVLIVKQLI
jgi:hypothetical protein